jgi:hypothetical protein
VVNRTRSVSANARGSVSVYMRRAVMDGSTCRQGLRHHAQVFRAPKITFVAVLD